MGVIVDNFGQMKEEAEEAGEAPSILLTKAQAEANVKLIEAQQALSVQRVGARAREFSESFEDFFIYLR